MDLPASNFPHIYATFKSQMHVNFLLEPIEGITLYDFQKDQVCIKMEHVKFFAAKTLVLLEYLHKQQIIFRDLKSENILIEAQSGELKIVDFGFAKDLSKGSKNKQIDRTFTKCGTPGYTAPEVLLQEEGSNVFNIRVDNNKAFSPQKSTSKQGRNLVTHDFASISKAGKSMNNWNRANVDSSTGGYSYPADVWSWGVLVCELIGGFNPFQGQSVQETFENIQRININWPRNLNSASS